MVMIRFVKCSYCGLIYADWQGHSDNECKRRLKLQLERLRERVRSRSKKEAQ